MPVSKYHYQYLHGANSHKDQLTRHPHSMFPRNQRNYISIRALSCLTRRLFYQKPGILELPHVRKCSGRILSLLIIFVKRKNYSWTTVTRIWWLSELLVKNCFEINLSHLKRALCCKILTVKFLRKKSCQYQHPCSFDFVPGVTR